MVDAPWFDAARLFCYIHFLVFSILSTKGDDMLGAFMVGLFLLGWSFLFAMIEIAIEGPVGWALAAPTWRMRHPLYAAVMGGKELTGYHLWMFFLPLWLLHLPFVIAIGWGVPLWTVGRECELLACYFALCSHWDFLWFVLNPHFGTRRFRRGEIWWHEHWIGRVPTDYFAAAGLVILLTAVASISGGVISWLRMGMVIAVLGVGLIGFVVFAEPIRQWHEKMCATSMCDRDGWGDLWKEVEPDLFRLAGARSRLAEIGRRRARRDQLAGSK